MRKIAKKILVAGTFDIIHPGHIFLINQAAELGDVYVVVATSRNREKFKGIPPIVPEEQRLEVIKSLKNVKEAVLGRKDNNTLMTVAEINPDIILLGPDQKFNITELKKGLEEINLGHIDVVRLETYHDMFELHSSSKIKEKVIEQYLSNTKEN